MAYMRLGELLVAAGMITEDDVERGIQLQKGTNKRLGTVLIDNGIISERDLIEALQMQLGIEYIDLTKVAIPTEMAQAMPKSVARQYDIVPVRVVKDELFLAMSDPLNFYAIEEARKASKGKKIVPMVATAADIERAIQVLYSNEGAAKAIEEIKRESTRLPDSVAQGGTVMVSTQIGEEAADSAPTIRLVNSIIERAVTERASDIHLEPREDVVQTRMRVDGILHNIMNLPKDVQASVIARLKVLSNLDVAEHRVPQDGRFNVKVRDKDIDLRVSVLPTIYGEKVVLRLLDKSRGWMSAEEMGLQGAELAKFNSFLGIRSGVILLVGPTGSGKTTTMYSMIDQLNTEQVNLVTLEDPVEYNVDNVNQVQINDRVGMTFANGLRAVLRQDPDIIAVGEIRDGETAEIAMRSAITGHLVLTTVHTNDAIGAIERLEDIGVETHLIASAMRGVVSQRLVRRVCPTCREAYYATEEEQAALRLKYRPDRVFQRGTGCAECFNTGYRGRVGVFEFLPVNRQLRALIHAHASRDEFLATLRQTEGGFTSLMENALRLVHEGVTTSEEVLRVVNAEE